MDIYSYALLLSRIKKLEEGGTDASGLEIITEAPTADNPDDDLKIVVLEKEPLEKYNGYLYLCEKPLQEIKIIDFDGEETHFYTLYAEYGMTWQQWAASKYNWYYNNNDGTIIRNFWNYNSQYNTLYHSWGSGGEQTTMYNNIFMDESGSFNSEKNQSPQTGMYYPVETSGMY